MLAADPAERCRIVRHAIEDGLDDAELAFDLIAIVRDAGDRMVFGELVATLRDRAPALFASHAIWYIDWLIEDALLDNQEEALSSLCTQLVFVADQDEEIFAFIVDRLAYFGRLSLLALLLPQVVQHSGIRHAHTDEILLLSRWHNDQVSPNSDAAGSQALHSSGETLATRWLAQLNMPTTAEIPAPPAESATRDAWQLWLEQLTYRFLVELIRHDHIPATRGSLARSALATYLIERLIPVAIPTTRHRLRSGRRNIPAAHNHATHGAARSIPDRASLEAYLAHLIDLPSPRYYAAAALLELTPAWLRFLEQHALVSHAERMTAIQQLRSLVVDSLDIWGAPPTGITVAPNIRMAWEEAD